MNGTSKIIESAVVVDMVSGVIPGGSTLGDRIIGFDTSAVDPSDLTIKLSG